MAAPSPAPCCLKALRDATIRWPGRNRASDGIMGDAAHRARRSDHNDGNAFDLTQDPAHGVDCSALVPLVLVDPRITYVIWNHRIYMAGGSASGSPYTGSNPHTHHMHVSIKAASRSNLSPWPWSASAITTSPPAVAPGPWVCGSRNCPGHARPEHRCKPGNWSCGRKHPSCPGHNADYHKCPNGDQWHCGKRGCPTHNKPEHACKIGPWYCGRTRPPCLGHGKREHRCEHGAALLIPR